MQLDTITLTLDGDVYLVDLKRALENFTLLVDRIAAEEGAGAGVEWRLEALDFGGASWTVRGLADDPAMVDRIVRRALDVSRHLEANDELPYAETIQRPAERMTKILNGRVTAIRLQSAEEDATIYAPYGAPSRVTASASGGRHGQPLVSHGAIEGRIQALANRGGLRFTLFDVLDERAVSCYLQPGQEDVMRNMWDRRAVVEGLVFRDPRSGRAVAVRQITNITPLLEPEPGRFRDARGALPQAMDSESWVEVIRKVRDAV